MDILQYEKMTEEELKWELIKVSHDLAYWYDEYGAAIQSHRRRYLTAYIQSPGGSVSAKEKDADFNTIEESNIVTDAQYRIESMVVTRDLLLVLIDHA